MSHATVLVVLKEDEDLNEVMAPYDENASEEYLEFEDITEDLLDEYKEEIKEAAKNGRSVASVLVDDCGYVEKEGRFGTVGNPKDYWDWFEVGGRWEGYLKLNKKVKKLI